MEREKRDTDKVTQFRDISPIDQAIVDRLVADRRAPARQDLKQVDLTPIASVFRRTLREASDIRNIFQTMPDLNLPREILVSAICAPGDLSKPTLVFQSEMKGVNSAIKAQLVAYLEDFFVNQKRLVSKVPEWIDDALIWSGAHPIVIIPESSLDRLILGGAGESSMESALRHGEEWEGNWYRPKGIFGLPLNGQDNLAYMSFESAKRAMDSSKMAEYHTIKHKVRNKTYKLPFMVTDNMSVLRTPAVQTLRRARVMENAYGAPALESKRRERDARKATKSLSNSAIRSKFFKTANRTNRGRLEVLPTSNQTGRPNLGHPLELHPAIEAMIPICVPGDVTNQIGAILLLDRNGYPISYTRRTNYYQEIRSAAKNFENSGSSSHASGEILQFAKDSLGGSVANATEQDIDRLALLHAQIIEQDLLARLKAGVMGGDFEISKPDHINHLMLARSFKNEQTIMLYVPAELMIYMAYDYNEFGVGKSILEDAKPLAAMRAAVQVANVIGTTKNAIPGKDINIELDPEIRDPVAAVTYMSNEALGLAYNQFPLTISSTASLAEALQLSAFSINVKGNPRFPEITTSVTPREAQYAMIDTDLLRQLRDDLTRVFSLTSEMVDGVNQPEFATTAVTNNLMLLKRVLVVQDKTNPFITDYVRTFTYNSGVLIEELMEIVEQNAKNLPDEYKDQLEDFLEDFINTLHVKLPAPPSENLTKQLQRLDEFSQAIDKYVPIMIREEYGDDLSPDEMREVMPKVIEAYKGTIMRQFMRREGLLRELDIFENTEDGSPAMDLVAEMSGHVDSVMNVIGEYVKLVAEGVRSRKGLYSSLRKAQEKARAAVGDEPADTGDTLTDGEEEDVTLDDQDNQDDPFAVPEDGEEDPIPEEEPVEEPQTTETDVEEEEEEDVPETPKE